jgi:hypothetical protein
MKNTIITLLVIILVGVGVYFLINAMNSGSVGTGNNSTSTVSMATSTNNQNSTSTINNPYANNGSSTNQNVDKTKTVIGASVQGNDINAYHYGSGPVNLLFVGGIHGGYEWNTVLVAYQLMDYLAANPDVVPANVTVTVIPVLNPDGLEKTVGNAGRFYPADVPVSMVEQIAGRFNANNVDLNRNFDCDWQAKGVWQNKQVSGGTAPFSEPESQAFKSYIESLQPAGVVFWYSAAGGVYTSNCHNGVLPETRTIADLFAHASGYPVHDEFNFYDITGDAVNWLAKQNIPGISILLTNHTDTEWTKNLAGIKALFAHYSK